MGFIGIYKATYDYTPQSEGELQITEGDLLYLLDRNTEEDWWKVKKKAGGDDEDEPEGLIPSNYVEEVRVCFALSRRGALSEGGMPAHLTPFRPSQQVTLERSTNTQGRQTKSCPSRKTPLWRCSIHRMRTGSWLGLMAIMALSLPTTSN